MFCDLPEIFFKIQCSHISLKLSISLLLIIVIINHFNFFSSNQHSFSTLKQIKRGYILNKDGLHELFPKRSTCWFLMLLFPMDVNS